MAKKVNKEEVVILRCSFLICIDCGSLIAIRLMIYGRLRRTIKVNAVLDEYPYKNNMPNPTVPESPWMIDIVILFIYLFTQNQLLDSFSIIPESSYVVKITNMRCCHTKMIMS